MSVLELMLVPAIVANLSSPSTMADRPVLLIAASEQSGAAPSRQQQLYDQGTAALDAREWERAVRAFSEAAALTGPRVDGALYWHAYALHRSGRSSEALRRISELRRQHPTSRWIRDASALEIEVRQATGQPAAPERQEDIELKLMAINSLMSADPERAVPLLETVLARADSPKLQERALFVLAQSGAPQARNLVAQIARGQKNPEQQLNAVRFLGIAGGEQHRETLLEIYRTSPKHEVKNAVLESLMISGSRDALATLARTEPDAGLKESAIRRLGLTGGRDELWQMYQGNASVETKEAVLEALFLSGDAQHMSEVARTERNAALRRTAINKMGLMGAATSEALASMYDAEKDHGIKSEIINAFFLQGNATALVRIARTESDRDLRKEAIQRLSLMGGHKEASDFMLELLKQ